MDKPIKISVAVITYNQESTIRQTLDSILMQKGDFDLEIVIGEDCSIDATHAICEEYAMRFNELTNEGVDELKKIEIKLLPNTHNLGITANYFRVLQACTGEFIGDIAGDDYYCDDHALEKQLHYLQAHSEVGVIGANGYCYYIRRKQKVAGLNPVVTAQTSRAKEFYFSRDYRGGVYFKPVGTMIRREMLDYIDYAEILRRKLPVEDYPMQAVWSQYTKFACLPDLLVTYRIYSESATFISFDHPKYLSYYKGLADTRRYLNELFPADTCFTEEDIQEQLFYKEFLLYLHRGEYKRAKQFVAEASPLIRSTRQYHQAKKFVSSWFGFTAFRVYKELNYQKELKQRT